jgi:LytS/YehU family sensor histidine kinase
MPDTAFLGLAQNAALLLAVAFVYDVLSSRFRPDSSLAMQGASGLLLGILGCLLILSPWTYVPGIVFDTRSVLLSVSGLFFGAVPTMVAMAMTALLRLQQGGSAAWTGVAVILATGSLGIAWRHLRRRPLAEISWRDLYCLGLVAHLLLLALMLTLPWETAKGVLAKISLPVLAIYPLATALLGLLMVNRLRRQNLTERLQASEERLRLFFESPIAGMAFTSPAQGLPGCGKQPGPGHHLPHSFAPLPGAGQGGGAGHRPGCPAGGRGNDPGRGG